MNILILSPKLGSGGIEKLVSQWYEAGKSRRDFRFFFAVYEKGGAVYERLLRERCVIEHLAPISQAHCAAFRKNLKRLLKTYEIDLIHINAGPLSWIVLKTAKECGVRARLVHAHTNLYEQDKGNVFFKGLLLLSRFLNKRYATKLLGCSNEAAKYCFGRNYGRKDYTLLFNGIDLEEFAFDTDHRNAVRGELGIGDRLVLGFVGRLTYQKFPEFALGVIRELIKLRTDIVLLMIGTGELEEMLKKLADTFHIADRVIFLGARDDVYRYYSAMDALLVPSRFEGLSIVTIEAQAAGLPIYVSEYVPREAYVTDLVQLLPVGKGEKPWAEKIDGDTPYAGRTSRREQLKAAGYDMNESCQSMMDVYQSAAAQSR